MLLKTTNEKAIAHRAISLHRVLHKVFLFKVYKGVLFFFFFCCAKIIKRRHTGCFRTKKRERERERKHRQRLVLAENDRVE